MGLQILYVFCQISSKLLSNLVSPPNSGRSFRCQKAGVHGQPGCLAGSDLRASIRTEFHARVRHPPTPMNFDRPPSIFPETNLEVVPGVSGDGRLFVPSISARPRVVGLLRLRLAPALESSLHLLTSTHTHRPTAFKLQSPVSFENISQLTPWYNKRRAPRFGKERTEK